MKPQPPMPPIYDQQPTDRCAACHQHKWKQYRSGWRCQFCYHRVTRYVAELNRVQRLEVRR